MASEVVDKFVRSRDGSHRCIKMMENLMLDDKSKHIEIRYHYIRDMVHRGAIKIQYVGIDE